MNRVLKNYSSTLLLLSAVIIGGICGVIFGEKAAVVAPVGELFLNFVFVLIVPLVFFSISSSICSMTRGRSLGRLMLDVLLVFLVMSFIAALVMYISTLVVDPLGDIDRDSLIKTLPARQSGDGIGFGAAMVSALSVPDFVLLFSKEHLLPLIIISALTGWAAAMLGEAGESVFHFLKTGSDVVMKMMDGVMKLAPIGLGCYFASIISGLGSQIMGGFLRSFLLYTVVSLLFFFVLNPLYIFLFRGADGLRAYWTHIWPPSITAIATTSSAAAMPPGIEAARRMGVAPEIAESIVPLGTNLHKDGSVMAGLLKIVFLMSLFGQDFATPVAALMVIGLAIIASLVTGAVPSGAGTGELLTCMLMGFSPEMVGMMMVISTLVDIPATLMNSSSNVVAAALVDSLAGRRKK